MSVQEKLAALVLAHGEDNEATAFPFWYIAVNGINGRPVMVSHGFWFDRKSAEAYLEAKAYRFPKKAFVYCESGHDSSIVRGLYDLARRADAPGEAEKALTWIVAHYEHWTTAHSLALHIVSGESFASWTEE